MKTLTTPIANEAAAAQSAWCELYDFYLKSSITTPFGSTSVLRLTTLPGGVSFFTPVDAPEPVATQGNAQAYQFWPLKRELIRGSSKFQNDKLQITASNVTAAWAQMLADVDWYDTPVVIRKISPNVSGATNADFALVWSGLVDTAKISALAIQFECSSDLGTLSSILPNENMHANCRFRWADDLCTAIRFHTDNYKAGSVVGNASTTTLVKSSSAFTKDTGANGSYGTDLVDALSDGAITASSFEVPFSAFVLYVFTSYDRMYCEDSRVKSLPSGSVVRFTGSPLPSPLVADTDYFLLRIAGLYYPYFLLEASPGGGAIDLTSTGTSVYIVVGNLYGPELVKASHGGFWAFDGTGSDWGNVSNAYYQIPDAQAGLKNAALKPYIQFDFGSAKTPRLWRVMSRENTQTEERLRLIEFFSSPNASDWTFESYFEMPNVGGRLFDVLIPNAATARYWRICVRSRWAESLYSSMFQQVSAYEGSRNWWQDGQITFGAATTTVELRGVTRGVLESYNGEIVCAELPVAPADGDVFVIERGCARTFNACAARLNTENYGGFNDLPTQTVIR